jgi:hypothetical protein
MPIIVFLNPVGVNLKKVAVTELARRKERQFSAARSVTSAARAAMKLERFPQR